MTVFDRTQFDHPLKYMAYGGAGLSKLRRQVGNNLYRLERGRQFYRAQTKTPVQALPQFATLPISSPTSKNAGPFVYTSGTQQIQRPAHVGLNQILPP